MGLETRRPSRDGPTSYPQDVGVRDVVRFRGSTKTLHHRERPEFRGVAKSLAVRIRNLGEERDWTIEMAAERFGVEPAHVRRIENKTANSSLAVLVSVARAFGMSVSELLNED